MSRLIKFRVWNVDKKSWVNPYYTALKCNVAEGNQQILRSPAIYNNFGEAYGDYIIQQFTGLSDKNGVEIYEGDIISVRNKFFNGTLSASKQCVVYYEFLGFHFKVLPDNCGENKLILSDSDLEIIGNILENPELIEDGKDKKFA
jgi:uncharacterized phage protein (TIGR01671 family)